MKLTELGKIKEYQRDFYELFDRKLEIDWLRMKGLIDYPREDVVSNQSLEELFNDCVSKHGADANKLRAKKLRVSHSDYEKERRVLIDFSKAVISRRLNTRKAALLINRDRSVLYHFLNCM